jgi:succinoglycan biosynthesis protein ExoA
MLEANKFVSVIMPVLNEVDHLPAAIESLAKNGYPLENLEFILVDGGSTDGTLDLIESIKLNPNLTVRVLENELRTTPHALNIAIRAASHSIILRADAHAIYLPNYISNSVRSLEEGKGDNIGGLVISRPGETSFSKVLSLVLNSVIGNGGAAYRSSTKGKFVDTVWCGCWFKQTLEKIGMFNSNWNTNQDAELNARLIANGYKVYLDPSIRAELVVRQTYSSFLKQYFNYGRGRIKTLGRYPSLIHLRQVLPVLGVAALTLSVFTAPLASLFVLTMSALFAVAVFCQRAEGTPPVSALLWVVPIVVSMNVLWVLGVLYGLPKLVVNRNANNSEGEGTL